MKLLLAIYCLVSVFSSNGIENDINKYLKEKLSLYQSYTYETLASPQASKNGTIEIDRNGEFKLSGSIAYIPALIKEAGRERRAYISLRVKLYQLVYTAAHKINKGDVLNKHDFRLQTAEITGLKGEPLTDINSIEKLRCRLPLKEGDILVNESVEKTPTLLRGSKVAGYLLKGNVIITMDAELREDGCEGETVRVIAANNKIFKAVIIDENSVKIIE